MASRSPRMPNIKSATKKTIDELNEISGAIRRNADKALNQVMQEAKVIAQERLSSVLAENLSTQSITPQEAANQIGVKFDAKNHKAYLYAPKDHKYKNDMYYMEYGAGLSAGRPKTNKYGTNVWSFPIKHKYFLRYKKYGLAFDGKVGGKQKYKTGMGFIMKVYKGEVPVNKFSAAYKAKIHGETKYFGITNTNLKIGYMKHARQYIMKNAAKEMRTQINLYLGRRYYKHKTPSVGGDEEE